MITANMIKELREKTGAGVMNCKTVLNETNGNIIIALEILKAKEAEAAEKKAERVTTEGLIRAYVSENKRAGVMVEVNCETDFVSANREFVALVDSIAVKAMETGASSIEALTEMVKGEITTLIAKFGENITLSKFASFTTDKGIIHSYTHNGGRIGVLIELKSNNSGAVLDEAAKETALQIAAAKPLFLDKTQVDNMALEKVKQEYREQALAEGKPERIVEKIVSGRVSKYYKENCLLEQPWIKNEDMRISELLIEYSGKQGSGIEVKRFARFERREGQ